jgi:hypothetical protein
MIIYLFKENISISQRITGQTLNDLLIFQPVWLSLLQTPSSEQGGVSHLWSLPQQVLPLKDKPFEITEPKEEKSFIILDEPQK